MRFLPVVLLVAICLMFGVSLLNKQESNAATGAAVAMMVASLPTFDLPTLDGGTIKSADIKGPAIVNVFATWCAPCVYEYSMLAEASKKYGVPVYGIAWKDNPVALQRQQQDGLLPYERVLLDNDGVAMLALGARAVPESFIIDANGKIVMHITGALTTEMVETDLSLVLDGSIQ